MNEQIARLMSGFNAVAPDLAAVFYEVVKEVTYDPACPTAATDGKSVVIGPTVLGWPLPEQVVVLTHEVLHIALNHPARAKQYAMRGFGPDMAPWDHDRWNKAADYLVNAILMAARIGRMPACALWDPSIGVDKVVDVVYCQLPPTPEDQRGKGGPGGGQPGFDEHRPYPGDPTDPVDQAARQSALSQALSNMGQGEGGGLLQRILGGLLERKVPFAELLRDFFTSNVGRGEPTFARQRRRWSPGVILPGTKKSSLGTVVVCMDVSGSIGQKAFDTFVTETGALFDEMTPEELHVIPWDYDADHFVIESLEELVNAKFTGGGGTDYRCAIRKIHELGIEPDVVVLFSDCDASWPAAADVPWPHLTISTTSRTCPFGQNVRIEV